MKRKTKNEKLKTRTKNEELRTKKENCSRETAKDSGRVWRLAIAGLARGDRGRATEKRRE
jgi:hypothetical protein